jgi:hypothetical protein
VSKKRKQHIGIAVLVAASGVTLASPTPPTDVVATLPDKSTRLVATIRPDEIACRALIDPQDWFVLVPSTGSLTLVDKSLGRITLDHAAVVTWRDELIAAAKDRVRALAAAASEPGLSAQAKATLATYLGRAPKQIKTPSVRPIEQPLPGSTIVPEIQQLNQHLANFKEYLKKEMQNAEPAGQPFACGPEFQYLPTKLKSPNTTDSSVLTAAPPSPVPVGTQAKSVGRLADLFVHAPPQALPHGSQPKH